MGIAKFSNLFDKFKKDPKELWDQLLNYLKIINPILEKSGYRLTDVEVGVGLIPSIIIHYEIESGAEDFGRIKNRLPKENNVARIIIEAFEKMEDIIVNKLKLKKEMIKEIEIELSVPPKIVVHLNKEMAKIKI